MIVNVFQAILAQAHRLAAGLLAGVLAGVAMQFLHGLHVLLVVVVVGHSERHVFILGNGVMALFCITQKVFA